jgi:hypothetical protein
MHIQAPGLSLSSLWTHAPFCGPQEVMVVSDVRGYRQIRQCFRRAALGIDQGGEVSRNTSPRAALCLAWTATKFEQTNQRLCGER